MQVVTVEGLDVEFPFEPYAEQVAYMAAVIRALDGKTNALLESPTGTGKTLCLLCATLAWTRRERARLEFEAGVVGSAEKLRQRAGATLRAKQQLQQQQQQQAAACNMSANDSQNLDAAFDILTGASAAAGAGAGAGATLITQTAYETKRSVAADTTVTEASADSYLPRIIYSSRTHSQLAQVMKELRRCRFAPAVNVRTLASRQQLCTNPAVRPLDGASQNTVCRSLVRNRQCPQHRKTEAVLLDRPDFMSRQLLDIEELAEAADTDRLCGYFLSRHDVAAAEVVLVPYNYLIDPTVRQSMGLEALLANAVVIVDEAHNIESVCEDSASFELTPHAIALAVNDAEEAERRLRELTERAKMLNDPAVYDTPATVHVRRQARKLAVVEVQHVLTLLLGLQAALQQQPTGSSSNCGGDFSWMEQFEIKQTEAGRQSSNGGSGNCGKTYSAKMLVQLFRRVRDKSGANSLDFCYQLQKNYWENKFYHLSFIIY